MPLEHIPFNRPLFLEQGMVNVRKAFENHHISGDGEFTRLCERFFESELRVHRALLTTSCTDALEMCSLLLDIGPGDEVIIPSFTFVSTANAFILRGAHPVFVDIRCDTLNMDETAIEAAITQKTKAIVVIHYAGVACEMAAIATIAKRHGLTVIEDNAHGLFGSYKGRPLGSLGHLSTLSFHETKNISCGEGGALLINEVGFAPRAEVVREKGTDRSRFFRGEIDKYLWRDIGSSYLPSDILAAILWAQIEVHKDIQEKRRGMYEKYLDGIRSWAVGVGAALPAIPVECGSSYHLFHLLLPDLKSQRAFIRHLAALNINAVFHYQPLHLSPMGVKFGGKPGQYTNSESAAARIVRLPFFVDLSIANQDRVIESVQSFAG